MKRSGIVSKLPKRDGKNC